MVCHKQIKDKADSSEAVCFLSYFTFYGNFIENTTIICYNTNYVFILQILQIYFFTILVNIIATKGENMNENLRIIIADDNKVLVDMTKGWIEKNERYKVVGIANDEEDEITLIDRLKPDVVITDIRKKNGWTGIKIIENYIGKDYTPTFFIISAGVMHYIDDIRRLKISHYLSKPFNVDDLHRILNDIYDEFYPKAMINLQNDIMEKENRSFWERIIRKLKGIG